MEKLNKILLINNIKKYIMSFTEKTICKYCKLKYYLIFL